MWTTRLRESSVRLAIYGTGGTGREVHEIVERLQAEASEPRWESVMFIDDFTQETELYGSPIVSFETLAKHYRPSEVECIVAVGEPSARELLYQRVTEAGYGLATIVHPTADVSPHATLGAGVFVKMFSVVSSEAVLGDNVFVQAHCIVGHDVHVGAHTQISAFSHIAGGAQLGERCYLGVGSRVREECVMGDDVVLSMGAVVIEKKVPSRVLAMGNPAKYVRRKAGSKVFA